MHPSLEPGAVELLVQLEQAGALTPTGLTLTDPNLPIGQAEAIGTLLGRMHMSVRFAIGDWLLFIERVYPDEWSQLSEVLGMDYRTVRDYMRVSERVPRSVRRPKLEWSQHRAVAALSVIDPKTGKSHPDIKAQKEWLKKAEVEQLSHHALRDALREGKPDVTPTSCRCCGRAYG
jgi:hypothetical protein